MRCLFTIELNDVIDLCKFTHTNIYLRATAHAADPSVGHKTQRNLAQTRPKQQPPGDRLKTSKHHLNPDANPAKNPPPQRAEVTSLKPIKEKKQAPARGHKTQRNLAQTRPKQQPPGDRLKTSKHHLNPDANPAKNPPPQRAEVTSLKPIKEKKQAPARGHKTQRNLAQTRPKQQPPGDRLKTSKHHLNPDANPAKNPPPQRAEVTSLKPIKEKKQAPARGHKTQRNLAQTRPKQQPPGDRLKTSKHQLNPDANPAKNPPPQRAEVTSLKPIKEKKHAPARGHKTQRNLAQTRPKTATSRRSTQNIQTPPKSGRKPSKKPSPTACRSDKSETHKGEETGSSTWTQNATQPSPDTPKTATSRRSTQNIQTPPKSGRKPSKKPSPTACRSDKSETHKGEETGSSTWTQNATQPSPDTPKTATSRRSTQNIQTPPKSGRKPSKKPSPAACRSDKSETHKGEETGSSTWTQNATQPSPDTPKTATSRRSTQNIQTPPKSGRKPSKKPSPAACRSDKSETPKGEETGPSTWTQNATQPSPDTPKTATSRRSTQNSQTPHKSGRKPSQKPSPAAWRSDKSQTPKGEETGPSSWTQNATQPRTRNSQTPLLLHEHTNANLRVAYALLFASPSKKARGRRIYIHHEYPFMFFVWFE